MFLFVRFSILEYIRDTYCFRGFVVIDRVYGGSISCKFYWRGYYISLFCENRYFFNSYCVIMLM